jgi:predicted phosphohydrolase
MNNYAWITDIHLNFLDDNRCEQFAQTVANTQCDGVFITGDISEAPQLKHHLQLLERIIQKPIWYTLGNHDYWNSSFAQVRHEMTEMSQNSKFLKWLPAAGVVSLTPKCALIGHDGWYDAGCGDWRRSNFQMVDWSKIQDYTVCGNSKPAIVSLSKTLAMEGAQYIENKLTEALLTHDNVVILTHFPPWPIVAVHRGKPQDDNASPWYVSKMMGESIGNIMNSMPEPKRVIVYAGHTHGQASAQMHRNTVVHVGGADYGAPAIQKIIQL